MTNKKRTASIRGTAVGAAAMAVFVLMSSPALAAVRLPGVFGNGMVLQRDARTPVWGWAEPGEDVVVAIDGIRVATRADDKGAWRADLTPHNAGGPYELAIQGSDRTVLKNVYFGDVWLCAGQSNMTFPLKRAAGGKEEIASAKYPQLRVLTVPQRSSNEPQTDFSASWKECSPKTAGEFSAVAYYFGQMLHEKLQVAVGIITASWSGSTAEAWTPENAIAKFPELASLTDPERVARAAPSQRTGGLFNGMIAPVCPYAIKGVVWYQGESNANRAWQYRTLFPLLIASWRENWGQGDFPFCYVQLPNFMKIREEPASSAWAELREAQHKALAERNAGEVVTVDSGETNDLHPKNKQVVGTRLANLVLARFYGFDVPWSGPDFLSMKIVESKAVLTFAHAGAGLRAGENDRCDASKLRGFAVAGSDRVFHWAEAEITGENEITVSSPDVSRPVAVRYGWADNPVCNLTNDSGLPASPFRTDDWAGVTVDSP